MYRSSALFAVLCTSFILNACGTAKPGGMSGPTIDSKNQVTKRPALQSNDVMDRIQQTQESEVLHILISWKDKAKVYKGQQDPRARERTAEGAKLLVKRLYKEAKAGADFKKLMKIYSEDPGSAKTGNAYTVEPKSQFVYEFKHMGLRLKLNEVGIVLTQFGWHIMKRVE